MSIKIKGIVRFQEIEGGFWSIISENHGNLRPQNMPSQFMEEGAEIECRVEYLEEDFGMTMWGDYIRIVSFKTIGT